MSKWEKVKLGDIAEINPSKKSIIDNMINKKVSFIGMTDITENGLINVNNVVEFNDVATGYTYFKENDILFAKITPCMENGKGAIAINLYNGFGVGSTEFHVVRTNVDVLLPEYIYYILQSKGLRHEAEKRMTGSAGQKRVPKEFLDNLLIPLPSLEEQRIVSLTLNNICKLLSMRRQQINELDKLVNPDLSRCLI